MSKERKKKEVILTRENAMILPRLMTEMGMTPSIVGNRISKKLIRKLQDPFKEMITDHKKNGGWQLSIFDTPSFREKYLGENKLVFDLKMSDLADAPNNYQQAFDFTCKVQNIQFLFPTYNDKGECVAFIRKPLYEVIIPGDAEVVFDVVAKKTGVVVEHKRMRLIDFMKFSPKGDFEVNEDSIQYRYRKGGVAAVGISMDKHVAEYVFNLCKYGRILDEVSTSSNNKYFAPIYDWLAVRQRDGVVEVDYKEWRDETVLGINEGDPNWPKAYETFAQFNKAILKKCLDELKELGERGTDCWAEVEKIYLNGRSPNPDRLRFHIHQTELGRELQRELELSVQMIAVEKRLREEFDQNDVQVYAISQGTPPEKVDVLLAKMKELKTKREKGKIEIKKDWQSYCNKSFTDLLATFKKEKEEEQKAKEQEVKAQLPVQSSTEESKQRMEPTKEQLKLWKKFQKGIRDILGEQIYNTFFEYMELYEMKESEVIISIPSPLIKENVEARFAMETSEAFRDAFGESTMLKWKIR